MKIKRGPLSSKKKAHFVINCSSLVYTLSKNISTFLLLKIKAPLSAFYVLCISRHSCIFSSHSYSHCTNYHSLRHFIYIRILFIILYFYGGKKFIHLDNYNVTSLREQWYFCTSSILKVKVQILPVFIRRDKLSEDPDAAIIYHHIDDGGGECIAKRNGYHWGLSICDLAITFIALMRICTYNMHAYVYTYIHVYIHISEVTMRSIFTRALRRRGQAAVHLVQLAAMWWCRYHKLPWRRSATCTGGYMARPCDFYSNFLQVVTALVSMY